MNHISVLLQEAVEALSPRPGGRYIDGTAGGGGHSALLLEKEPGAELLALDRDADAVSRVADRLKPFGPRATVLQMTFDRWREGAAGLGWTHIDGILLDLGFSSFQMDDAGRGFSFMRPGPLDMRLDRSQPETAADLVNHLPQDELVTLLRKYGEDPDARRIAAAIVAARPLATTEALADVVSAAVPGARRRERIHPATQTFQALRIAVNDELGQLERFLADLPEGLTVGGRVAVISFHSLEDRLVKRRFRELSRGCVCPPDMPVCGCGHQPQMRLVSRRAIVPPPEEIARNPRSRSAKLRVAAREAA